MDYSAADIEAAQSLQLLAYLYAAMGVFWTYDYACSFEQEWIFLVQSRWSKVKGLYIVTRHVPFFLVIMNLVYLGFTSNESPDKCRIMSDTYSCFGVISLTCSECFFVLRTYALWNRNKIVLVAMITSLFATTVSFISIFLTSITTSYARSQASQGATGAQPLSKVLLPFLLVFVFQVELISLTLICVVRTWRSTKSPLYAILVKHDILYYAIGLLFSTVNILMPVLAPDNAFYTVLEDLQGFLIAILATRMHLYLWRIDQQAVGTGLVCDSWPDTPDLDSIPYV
ncbi:hypothetical protein DEU56DRAFT_984839 [Suillus clintonianus]|uniref:uncharacterized protein n=1 Tax=Suillus clintonianus TaxID=1904413 RepID=UPI001B8717D8|nr:uncharacterized protein DEU56DRAFT_984839 [Suillus clintonianus]KAG2117581.1 hypothetical protein DEU56DRAFT_984839 [Suillus clintonianus]